MDNLTLAYVLIGFGIVLLAAELFLPTGGILFGVAMVAELAGVGMIFAYGEESSGWIALCGVFVLIPLFGAAMLYVWPRTPLGRRLIQQVEESEQTTVASMPVVQEMAELRGRFGRTLSPLRPSGTVDFDGRRVDVITEGMMVAAGQWVRCIDVKAGKVVVRPAEKPGLGELESTDFGV